MSGPDRRHICMDLIRRKYQLLYFYRTSFLSQTKFYFIFISLSLTQHPAPAHSTQGTAYSTHLHRTQGTEYTTQHTLHIHTGHRTQNAPHTTKHTGQTFAALELHKITEQLLTSSNIIIIEFYIRFITFDYKDVSFAISTSIERSINFLATYFQTLLKEVYSCSQ